MRLMSRLSKTRPCRRVSDAFLSKAKARLQVAFGARFRGLVLFGSEARGDARPDSDIDLLVLLQGPVRLGPDISTAVDAVYDLELLLDPVRSISVKPVDADLMNAQAAPLYQNAVREGIAL